MNYYTFDSIEKNQSFSTGVCGNLSNKKIEIYYPESGDLDNESDLTERGLAKCDAPNWHETMLVFESEMI